MGRALPVDNGGAPPPSSSVAAYRRPTTSLGSFLVQVGLFSETQVRLWEVEAEAAAGVRHDDLSEPPY